MTDHSGHPLLEDVLKSRSHEQARHVMCTLLQDCVECCADLEMSSSPARVLVELAELAKAGDANGPCELGHLSQAEISAFAGWRMGVNISLVCASHIASCDDCRAYFEGTVGDEEKAVQSAIEKMSFEQVVRRYDRRGGETEVDAEVSSQKASDEVEAGSAVQTDIADGGERVGDEADVISLQGRAVGACAAELPQLFSKTPRRPIAKASGRPRPSLPSLMAAALFGVVVGGAISQIFSSDGKVAGPERPKETIGAATVPQSALPVDPLAPPLLSAGAVIPFEDLELDRSVLRDNFRGPWCIVFPESRSGRAGIEFPWLFGCHAAEAECETRRAAVEARRKELSSIGETKCVLAKPSISCYAMRSVSDTSLNRCFLHRADCESSRVRRAFYPGRNILAISKKCEEVRSAADAERRTASATFPVETHPWAEWYGQRIKFGITVAGKNGVLKVAIPVGYFEQVPGGAFNVRFEKDDKDCSGAVFGRRILWSCSYPRSDQEGMFFRVIYLGWLEPGGCLAIGNGFLLKDDGWLEFRGGWRAELLDCTTENAETCEKLRRQVSKDRRKAKAREDYHLDPGAAEGANAICAGPGRGLPVCDRPFAGIEGLPVWQEDRVEIDVTVVGAQWRGKVSFLAWEASSREWISVQTCNASSCSRVLDKNELGDTPVLAAQAQSKTHYTLGWVDYPHAMELQRRYAESCGAEAKTPTD